jgi:hypothetical protein
VAEVQDRRFVRCRSAPQIDVRKAAQHRQFI